MARRLLALDDGTVRLAHPLYGDAHRRAGRRSAADAQARRGRQWQTRCEGAVTPLLQEPDPEPVALSRREREVARLATAGLSNAEIADRLTLSVRTVESHLYRVFAKLGVRHRDELGTMLPAPPRDQ